MNVAARPCCAAIWRRNSFASAARSAASSPSAGSKVISSWPWPISVFTVSTGMPLATSDRHMAPVSGSSRCWR